MSVGWWGANLARFASTLTHRSSAFPYVCGTSRSSQGSRRISASMFPPAGRYGRALGNMLCWLKSVNVNPKGRPGGWVEGSATRRCTHKLLCVHGARSVVSRGTPNPPTRQLEPRTEHRQVALRFSRFQEPGGWLGLGERSVNACRAFKRFAPTPTPSRIPALPTSPASGRSAARILEVGTLGNHLVAKRMDERFTK